MSNRAQAWAWQVPVGGVAKLVLVALADHSDDDGICWPGIHGVAAKCGVTDRAVQNNLAHLIQAGWVQVRPRYRENGSQKSNLYLLKLPRYSSISRTALEEYSEDDGPDEHSPEDQSEEYTGGEPTVHRGGEPTDMGGCTKRQGEGEHDAPLESSLEPSENKKESPTKIDSKKSQSSSAPSTTNATPEFVKILSGAFGKYHDLKPKARERLLEVSAEAEGRGVMVTAEAELFVSFWLGRGAGPKNLVKAWHNWLYKARGGEGVSGFGGWQKKPADRGSLPDFVGDTRLVTLSVDDAPSQDRDPPELEEPVAMSELQRDRTAWHSRWRAMHPEFAASHPEYVPKTIHELPPLPKVDTPIEAMLKVRELRHQAWLADHPVEAAAFDRLEEAAALELEWRKAHPVEAAARERQKARMAQVERYKQRFPGRRLPEDLARYELEEAVNGGHVAPTA